MRLAIIARMDKTGLGNQTRALVEMLTPHKILVIDSSVFGKGKQFPDFYRPLNAYGNIGMIKPTDGIKFLRGVDAVLSCETFYSPTFISDAKRLRVKTILQYNYEFFANHESSRLPLPDVLIAPSQWRIEEAREKFGEIIYLPPPTNEFKFAHNMTHNIQRTGKKKFLHIVGNKAIHDRNGTNDLIEALKLTDADFQLDIRTQQPLDIDVVDSRVVIDQTNPNDEAQLYYDYDAMILPRRYAGLCLPMNEALLSGLPVIMTDIDPNNRILPSEWLVEAHKTGKFMAKTEIDVYGSSLQSLADKLEWLCNSDLTEEKNRAYAIGHESFSFQALRPKYLELLEKIA